MIAFFYFVLMKKIAYLILILIVTSCNVFKEKKEYSFTYEFENKTSQRNILETIKVLKKRLDSYGVENSITNQKGDRLHINVKAINLDSIRLNSLILNQGKLEFWELFKGNDFHDFMIDVNEFFMDTTLEDSIQVQPLLSKIASQGYPGGPIVFQFKAEDTASVNKMLGNKEVRFLIPEDFLNVKFLWGVADEIGHHPLYAAKSNRDGRPPLTGASITDAMHSFGPIGRPVVAIAMNDKGALTWERITENAFLNSTFIAITINDLVYTAPGVAAGAIKGGRSEISGNFTIEEAHDLAIILSSKGKIPKLNRVNN